jgi:hypothetical protein
VGQAVDRDWMPIPQKVQTALENTGAGTNATTFKEISAIMHLICFILHLIITKISDKE